MADVFVPGGAGIDVSADVDRYVDSVFGSPFLAPRPEEEGMRFAQDAALRSAAPARQVGVALIPEIGTPVVAGTNEVPRRSGTSARTRTADDRPAQEKDAEIAGMLRDYKDAKSTLDCCQRKLSRFREQVQAVSRDWHELSVINGTQLAVGHDFRPLPVESEIAGLADPDQGDHRDSRASSAQARDLVLRRHGRALLGSPSSGTSDDLPPPGASQ